MATAKKNGAVGKKTTRAGKKKETGKKMGRPEKFTPELGDQICERMANGESLLKICRDEDMPHRATIHRWLLATKIVDVNGVQTEVKKFPTFCDKYDTAVAIRADLMFDQIEEIADESIDVIKKGAAKKSSALASAQRLRVDARKWYLGKIMPKKFSDKNVHVTEDEDGKQMPISGNVIQFAPQSQEKDG